MLDNLWKLAELAAAQVDQPYGVEVERFSPKLQSFIRAEPQRVRWVENATPSNESVRLLGSYTLLTVDEIEEFYDEAMFEFSRSLIPLDLWVIGYSDGSVWAHEAKGNRIVYMAPLFSESDFESNILSQWGSVATFVAYTEQQARQQ